MSLLIMKRFIKDKAQERSRVPEGFTPSLEVPNNEHLCDAAWVEHVAHTGEHYWMHGEHGQRSDTRP
jgi:hypothetical protein